MIKRYLLLLNILLITGAVYLTVKTFYRVTTTSLEPVQPNQAVHQKVPPLTGPAQRPLAHYQVITDRNLFSTQAVPTKKPRDIKIEELEQTKLQLKLWGTVTGVDGESYAVIEEGSKRDQNLFREGDSIQTASIKLILREKVVLTVNGKDEILEMEDAQGTLRSPSPSQVSQRRGSPRGIGRTAPTQKLKLRRSQIEEAVADVGNLMKEVRIRPHLENGQPQGFVLGGINARSFFRRLGLRNGDIITDIDGQPLQSAESIMQFYENLTSSSTMTIQLKRRGRTKTIEYLIE